MEHNETLDSDYSSGINLSPEIKDYLKETAKWAMLISIVGFFFIGLMVIGSIAMGFIFGAMSSEMPGLNDFPFPPALLSIVYLLFSLIGFIPILYLFRFATKMKSALQQNNDAVLSDAFRNLKSHYKFYGIFIIVMLALYLLLIIASVFGAGLM